MWLNLLAVVVGLAVLVWGADKFVSGAAALADNLGVSTLVIGLTVVGFGTSAPEILVSAFASFNGNPGLAIGNAIGSNIANIGLILGMTALIAPLRVHSRILKREYPVLLTISLLSMVLMWNGRLGVLDGAILLGGLPAILLWLAWLARKSPTTDILVDEFAEEIPHGMGTGEASGRLLLGLAALLVSSRMLVWGAINIAAALGVSELIIGLTVVALGTSLPELATSIASAIKGEHDLAIGNVVGSNIYNLLAVLSLPGLIAPGAVAPEVLSRDLPTMIVLTLAIFIMGTGFRNTEGRISRGEGLVLLATFAGYQFWLYLSATHPGAA